MSPIMIVILVVFVILLVVWGLINAGSIQGNPQWLAWGCCLMLGIVVFLLGSGVIVIDRYAPADSSAPRVPARY